MSKNKIPTYDQLMNPLIKALRLLGDSGTNEEIHAKVAEVAGLSDDQLEVLHNSTKGGVTEIEYRLGWAKTYLKKVGILENSGRGVWALTQEGKKTEFVDPREIVKKVNAQAKKESKSQIDAEGENDSSESWHDDLAATIQDMDPSAFERLVQRMLRESGFVQVEVTGRTGDGGIDGNGIMRLGGLLSFHVIFQCKRRHGSIGASVVRDFRGAMVGRADKALLVTTGTFTKDAMREATRDGAPAIDLMDGEQLLEKLKQLSLGVKTEKIEIERVKIDYEWFAGI